MRYVKQKHVNGCGIASLSMITGIGYDRMMRVVAPKRIPGAKYGGTTLEQTLKALSKLRIKYRMIFQRINLNRLKNDAYISISQSCGCRHAIVWDAKAKRLVDPDSGPDHNGKNIVFTKAYVKKHMNFIVEIIPS